ncbi:hypothetical protein [Bacillus paramycoides]|uniref:hypothetical protein n=1 Tax=Bacillus paramycoides TaxID=2026194 RepID=UPI003D001561
MYLLTDEKGLGTFKITNSISDTWIETIVSVGEGLIKKDVKFRYIKVLSVGDRRIKSYVDKTLPLIGAVTTANFERMEECNKKHKMGVRKLDCTLLADKAYLR